MLRSATVGFVLWAFLSGAAALKPPDAFHPHVKAVALIQQTKGVTDRASPIPKVPKVNVKNVFPVPTSARCVVIMVCQYMMIYTALAVMRTYYQCYYTAPLVRYKTRALATAAQTTTYCPMLCVLFIACRMRVEFLSDGKDQPQVWVQNCMYALTFAVLANSLVVLIYPLVFGMSAQTRNASGDLEMPRFSPRFQTHADYQIKFYVLAGVRALILLCLYGGIAGVIVGILLYLPPGETNLHEVPPPAPVVMCTMILTVAFFLTQLIIVLCQTYTDLRGVDYYAGHVHKVSQVMNAAASTMEFAPMVAIVGLAARMRALQHDSEPEHWVNSCMYAATCALCLTTVMAIVVPCVLGGSMAINPTTKESTFDVPNPTLGYIMLAVRFLCMFAFYAGVGGVICSIFTFRAPTGYETQPVSPTVHCVVTLAFQFFFVYAALICCLTISEVSGGQIPLETYKFYAAIEAAKSTLPFAPMLSVLFVTTRMYALLITDKLGAPQGWVQDAMYMSTWSLMISFLTCLVTGMMMDERDADGRQVAIETDDEGHVTNKFKNDHVTLLMNVLRYVTTLLLYGGIITVVVGLFVMTPETANGKGSVIAKLGRATQ